MKLPFYFFSLSCSFGGLGSGSWRLPSHQRLDIHPRSQGKTVSFGSARRPGTSKARPCTRSFINRAPGHVNESAATIDFLGTTSMPPLIVVHRQHRSQPRPDSHPPTSRSDGTVTASTVRCGSLPRFHPYRTDSRIENATHSHPTAFRAPFVGGLLAIHASSPPRPVQRPTRRKS